MSFLSAIPRAVYWCAALGTALLLGAFALWLLFAPPAGFQRGVIVTVPAGTTLRGAALLLEQKHAVRFPSFFTILLRVSGQGIRAGAYLFEEPQGTLSVALRLIHGDFGLAPVRLTFPEGITVAEMAGICARALIGCSAEEFLAAARGKEGYLFPETYFFIPGTPAAEVVRALLDEFEKRTMYLRPQAASFGQPFESALIMASLLEGEASTTKHRREVAGILWKRLSIDMPLQVDAAFAYVNGKTTFDLTREDLTIDSPYNTYTRKGLPPTPINNPGLDALTAALSPASSTYLYYLTGSDGVFHFARTYEEHLQNKARYLKKN